MYKKSATYYLFAYIMYLPIFIDHPACVCMYIYVCVCVYVCKHTYMHAHFTQTHKNWKEKYQNAHIYYL